MKITIMILFVLVGSLHADPTHLVCRVDAAGVVVEMVPTSTPSDASVGPLGPGESISSVAFVDLVENPTIKPDPEAVKLAIPVLRVVDGKLAERPAGQVKAGLQAKRDEAKAKTKIAKRIERMAAESILEEEPDNLSVADEVLKLKAQEGELK